MSRLLHAARLAARSSALVLTAFLLVATSQAQKPPRECFSDVGDQASLQVLVGAAEPPQKYPSCAGLDGLVSGTTLVFDVAREQMSNDCIAYDTRTLQGLSGVALDHRIASVGTFTRATGQLTLPQDPACQSVDWMIELKPEPLPAAGTLVSPFDAGPARLWTVNRHIYFDSSPACKAAVGFSYCQDLFIVDAIAPQAGP